MSKLKKGFVFACAALVAAYGVGQFTSKSISTEIDIDANAETVWQVLAEVDQYGDWNPLVLELSGELKAGEQLVAQISLPDQSPMEFKPVVLVADENKELRWLGRTGIKGLFDGEYAFVLMENADGTTTFYHSETFRGILVYALMPIIGESAEAGFVAMNSALKARAEGRT